MRRGTFLSPPAVKRVGGAAGGASNSPFQVQFRRFERSDLERLERELVDLLSTLSAYRQAIGELEAGSSSDDAPPEAPAVAAASAARGALAIADGEMGVGETGWALLGDGWVLRAPDGFRLRLNICERALMLALAKGPDHVISFDDFFELVSSTRAGYGQKPLAPTSMRMILMRLMKKLGRSSDPCPIVSVHGWGYRLRVDAERADTSRSRSDTQATKRGGGDE